MEYVINETLLEPQHAAVQTARVPQAQIGAFLGEAFDAAMTALAEQDIQVTGAPFARYDIEGSEFVVDAGFPCAREINHTGEVHDITLADGPAVTTMHIGPYEGVSAAYDALQEWMSAHGRAPTDTPWECYLDGPEVAEPRTIVVWPCAKIT